MSISPSDLLSQAEGLFAAAQSEAEFRNSIGRAYYAAYHAGLIFHDSLPSKGRDPPRKTGVHADLAFRLASPTIPRTDPRFARSQNIARHLEWLHDKRVKADYRLDTHVMKPECVEALRRARRAFELCTSP